MSDRDQSYLEDMLSYALDAIELLGDGSVEELATDKMRRYAVTRATEIVGEAATKVSGEGRARFAAIPWRSVIGMRNILIHGYVGLDLTILVDTVRNHFPPLIEMLRGALGDSQP
jgi:uncharacterized protein with HEPN domain